MSDSNTSELSGIESAIGLLSSALMELGILFMVGVWTLIWIYLSKQTMQTQGLLDGTIIAVYSLLPVIGILLWRLSERTTFELPQLTDFAETPDRPAKGAQESSKSDVAQRFETGS